MNRPINVLFILSEHHNPFFLGCAGNSITRTPNLDRLAVEGTRFDYTYCSSPLCVPARGALFSGRYPHEIGVWCNATPWDGQSGGWSFYLRENGVHLTTIGKLDFAPGCDHGIVEERLATHRMSLDIHSLYREQEIIPRYAELRQIRGARRREDYPARTADDETVGEAMRWLREDRPRDRRWVLNVNLMKAHPAWAPPAELWDVYEPKVRLEDLGPKYFQSADDLHPYFRTFSRHQCAEFVEADDIRRGHVGFHACCEMLDRYVGVLIGCLEELGILDETMIVYSTDHGANVHAHRCWSLMNLYEDSARVPLIIRHPGGVRGRVDRTPTHHHDVFATICEAVGLAAPADSRGVSLLPAVMRVDDRARRDFVLCEVHANGWPGSAFAVSDGHMKYVECVGERGVLFDLDEDRQEMHDLVVERPRDPAVRSAIARARRWLCGLCSPKAVDARAKSDQACLRAELERSGRLAVELVKRGYEPRGDRLVPQRELLRELGIAAGGGAE